MARPKLNPSRYFNSSPEVIRLAVMMYVRYPWSLRNAEDLLHERGVDICHETVRLWWNRFGPLFAIEIPKRWVSAGNLSRWRREAALQPVRCDDANAVRGALLDDA
ncbi:hypothetical protein ACMDCR_10625 [Labrys okinawensis]|uniref:hypothetical protein n=1 Tax=Labrys okinawensis TaxID=346911 RepID=UPI0039BD2491